MPVELDHVFVCTSPGAPEAERLLQLGLHEGPPNQHPGQGTACRRFSFKNAMLELFWVNNEEEARSEQTRRTLLWERWSGRTGNACPFGICLRPSDSGQSEPPFPSWEYRPSYLPDPIAMLVGEAGLAEPMWIYLSFMKRAQRAKYFVKHPVGLRELTGLTLACQSPLNSTASRVVTDAGVLAARIGAEPLLEIEFDAARSNRIADFRPDLPLLFRF